MSSSKRLLEVWIDAFNRRDIAALSACYASSAINHQVAAGPPAIGIESITADFESFFQGFPDSYAQVENIISENDWAAWEWVGGGTFLGGFLSAKPTGRKYELRGCGFFQFKEEKIILQRGYWDRHTWFSQVGLEI